MVTLALLAFLEYPPAFGFPLLMVSVTAIGGRLPKIVTLAMLMTCAVFATLPLLGYGHGSFIVPGTSLRLEPIVTENEGVLYSAYEFGEHVALDVGNALGVCMVFVDEGPVRVRPHSVFVIWFSMVLSLFAGMRRYRSPIKCRKRSAVNVNC